MRSKSRITPSELAGINRNSVQPVVDGGSQLAANDRSKKSSSDEKGCEAHSVVALEPERGGIYNFIEMSLEEPSKKLLRD